MSAMDEATAPSSNKRIAKNTLALYVRMFLTMIVGLYTSRVVLATLGVEDYGVYGVVGGIVSMLGFLNASMSGATSRFLTFELGRGDKDRLGKTFSSALVVHVGIALVVLVLAETVGLWFLCNKLVIPAGRMGAAMWVYQLSIASAMLGFTQVPYNATIIAHENMDVYAYVEILNSVLKLGIVYLLTIGNFDKLILYAVLMFAVSVVVMMTYRVYCLRHYAESHFHWICDKTYLRPLLSFSGWDLYGNMSVLARQQGINFLINMFFGVVYNAASSIATMVNGVVTAFAFNIIQASRPTIIKEYASGDMAGMERVVCNASKYTVLLFGCMLTPLVLELPYLMELWLGTVPDKAVAFCRLLLVASLFGLFNSVLTTCIHATGRIVRLSFITGSLFIGCVPVIYVLFRAGLGIDWAYVVYLLGVVAILVSDMAILKLQVRELSLLRVSRGVAQGYLFILAAAVLVWWVHETLSAGFVRACAVTAANAAVLGLLTLLTMDKGQKAIVKKKLCSVFRQ